MLGLFHLKISTSGVHTYILLLMCRLVHVINWTMVHIEETRLQKSIFTSHQVRRFDAWLSTFWTENRDWKYISMGL